MPRVIPMAEGGHYCAKEVTVILKYCIVNEDTDEIGQLEL